jgi:L-ornithine N5-oxygenase
MAPSAIASLTVERPGQPPANITHAINTQLEEAHLRSPTTNSFSDGHTQPSQNEDELLDLICIGFGPASLAIAIALHDTQTSRPGPKALFLEKQPHFAWHAGMQLPGAKMQISFLKDLATPRDPTSKFTFLNYLFQKGRLNHFINLGTFLPSRVEYEDYLRWCAGFFERKGEVRYGMEVLGVRVGSRGAEGTPVESFEVTARNEVGDMVKRKARHVVIAVGGRPVVPDILQGLKHVAHSSQSATAIRRIQESEEVGRGGRQLRFAVVGSGQSAAEIFNDLSERFPSARVSLVIKGPSLRPSDDSPL